MIEVKITSFFAFLLTSLSLVLAVLVVAIQSKVIIISESFCKKYSVMLEPETDEVDLEVGKGKLVKTRITNTGMEDEYKISAKAPNWIMVKPETLRLNTNETDYLFVYLSPDYGVSGDFTARIYVDSFCVHEDVKIISHVA